MIQIRNSVFETNSSSAHTIAVKNKDEYDYNLKWFLDEDGTFELWSTSDLDFGRSPFDVLCTTYQKIPYFIASFGFDKITKIIKKNILEVKNIKKPHIDSRWDDPDLKQGIDHQSIGMLQHFIKKNNLTVEEALFNNKYIIIIDGDEYNIWGKMIKCGLININNLEDLGKDSYFDGDSDDTD